MNEQACLFDDNAEYNAFVEKFKPKKTTDDCYTPPEIYEVIRDYVCDRWNVDPDKVVRPFWPGGDYQAFDYPDGAVVIDNPPFSILAAIKKFYIKKNIPFFLFCPSLTALSGAISRDLNHIICDCDIVYQNGAVVRTSFVTTFGRPNVMESCPELTRLVNNKMKELLRENKTTLPKYEYPNNIVTAAMVQRYSKYGVSFSVHRNDCAFVRSLDEQKEKGKAIYGGGLLLSDKKAAEKAAAEKAAAWMWSLSQRERQIVESLGRLAQNSGKYWPSPTPNTTPSSVTARR